MLQCCIQSYDVGFLPHARTLGEVRRSLVPFLARPSNMPSPNHLLPPLPRPLPLIGFLCVIAAASSVVFFAGIGATIT